MKRSTDRVLVTHVGSLVRPLELRKLIDARELGKTGLDEKHDALLRTSVGEVVAEQEKAGVDIPSDGEFGKLGWARYVSSRLTGMTARKRRPDEKNSNSTTAGRDAHKFTEFYAAYAAIAGYQWTGSFEPLNADIPLNSANATNDTITECVGAITYKDAEIKRDIANFQAALKGRHFEEAFLPVAAPESARGTRQNRYYKTEEEYFTAIADALHQEYRAIIDAGFLIQLDDAYLAHEYDRLLNFKTEKEVHKSFEAYIELLNYSLRGIPKEKVRYHVCWGSWNVPHTSDVPLRTIVDLILRVKAQAYALEAANPRHEHEWEVWKDVKLPDGKILIPGLVTHSTNVVEHPGLIAWRIKNFVSLIGRENIIAGTDCGFSQSYSTIRVHPQVQWAKLEALVEGARIATKALWGR